MPSPDELLRDKGATVVADGTEGLSITGMESRDVGILAAGNGVTLYELLTQRASLEDAFMDLTHEHGDYRAETVGSDRSPDDHVLTPTAATDPANRISRVFRATARSEWTKLRTVRSTMWALILTVISIVGIGVLLTALEVSRWDHRSVSEITGFDPLLYAFGGLPLAQLSVGVLGVLVMTSEYAKGAIRLTFAATPQRPLLLTAKAATFSAVIAVVSLASCFCAFFVCEAILGPRTAGSRSPTPARCAPSSAAPGISS
jgi:hypothetical protein